MRLGKLKLVELAGRNVSLLDMQLCSEFTERVLFKKWKQQHHLYCY